jgi:hypothetical protein
MFTLVSVLSHEQQRDEDATQHHTRQQHAHACRVAPLQRQTIQHRCSL